ncbi:MAG TPA: hypothetical protein VMT64_15245, partial [Candidatus Binataceae bacterium]|nr:hypothetical protein [Candidatus Binataceae bacterium]
MKALRKRKWIAAMAIAGMLGAQAGGPALASKPVVMTGGNLNDNNTVTPIKHVIFIIGENRTFDHLFGTYVPPKGQTIWNLLSEGIVNADGSPGPNFSLAQQWQASDTTIYSIHPAKTSLYGTLPQPNTGGPANNTIQPLFPNVAAAEAVEPALPLGNYNQLTIGGTGITSGSLDTRFPTNLPNGPFDITQFISYDD